MINCKANYGTFLNRLNRIEELYDKSIVKAIHDNKNIALWFSRCPFLNDVCLNEEIFKNVKKQIGLYWFSSNALKKFANSPMTSCEKTEQNESLRILEYGDRIYCHTSSRTIESINTEEDLLKLKDKWGCKVEYMSAKGNYL